MTGMRVRRTPRTGLVLCVAFLAWLTVPSDAYLFGSTSSTLAVSADDDVIRESTGTFSVAMPSTAATSSTSLSRPHTADEDVEAAEAALATNPTPTTHVTSTPTISTSKPSGTTAAPTSSASSNASTRTPNTTKPATSTPSPTPSSGSVSIDALSDGTSTTSTRGSGESSLDKTVVLAIVGIVGAVGITTLLVSRQIKKTFSPEDDDEWQV